MHEEQLHQLCRLLDLTRMENAAVQLMRCATLLALGSKQEAMNLLEASVANQHPESWRLVRLYLEESDAQAFESSSMALLGDALEVCPEKKFSEFLAFC